MSPEVDLAALARPGPGLEPPKRSKLRILVPLGLLLGLVAVFATTMTDLLRPRVDVTVVRPTAPNAAQVASLGEGTVVVQASGWVEPDPFLIHVPALAEGVVKELLVQESDSVDKDQIVATLVDDDARIALDAAQAEAAASEAALAEARARLVIADEAFGAALEVTEARAVAKAAHEGATAAAEHRAAAVVEGKARVELAENELVVQQELHDAGASGSRQVELARGAIDEARARLEGLRAEAVLASARTRESLARLEHAERDLELRLDDRLSLDLARTGVARAEADLRRAQATLAAAELLLNRMAIRAPASGVVLERLTVPGMVLSVNVQGHAVCSLFDPDSLRIRVDVPQSSVERLFVGQRTQVDAESRPDRPYEGEVSRIVHRANSSKVTLEAHVRVLEGDALLRPEMLAQVRFFGRPGEPGAEPASAHIVLVPSRLVSDGAVWVVGSGDEAQLREVELGSTHGDSVEVLSGLNLADKVIDGGRAQLREGDRVRIGASPR